MAYKELVAKDWKPEKEEEFIEGILINIQKDIGENKSMLYNVEALEDVWNVWGSAILDQRMTLARVGDKMKITYKGLGEAKPGRNAPKIFKVEVDRE